MKTLWNIGQRRPQDRAARQFQSVAMHLTPRRRVDVVLVAGLIVALVSLLVSATLVVVYADRQGWFDAPLVQPLKDSRKLVNVRDDLVQHPLLDAVLHNADNHVYISQQGGTIHRYDPATELWSTLHPFTDQPVSPDLIQLRSGCGTDPLSALAEECPDPDSLWMLGADGSLAQLRGRSWQVILNNRVFVGANGQPVGSEELTTAAVSDDGHWLTLGTRANGIGVYDLQERQWLAIPSEVMKDLPSREISHVVFWQDHFWLGTPHGLAAVKVTKNEAQIRPDVVVGKIMDLAAEKKRLWILSERPCDKHGDACLWLGQLDRAGDAPREVLAERNRYPDLSLASVNHAQYWDNHLVLAGESGIYSYDSVVHAWDRLFATPIQTVLTDTNKVGMFFGYPGGVGRVDSSFITTTWPITNELVVKLVRMDQDLLALTAVGNAWAVSETDKPALVFRHSNTTLDPSNFNHALAAGDVVLFMGPDGLLLHNVRTRQYEDVRTTLPDWLANPNTRFVTTARIVYAVEQMGSDVTIHILPIKELEHSSYFTNYDIANAASYRVSGPVEKLWPWEPYGLGLIASDSRVLLVAEEDVSAQTGAGAKFQLSELKDVVQVNDSLIAARSQDLDTYDLTDRAWTSHRSPSLESDEEIAEIAVVQDQLLLRTSLGRLLEASGTATSLIGDAAGVAVSDAALTDALAVGHTFYLAGGGMVQAYDAQARRIVRSWDLEGGGEVSLHNVLSDEPISLSDGIASYGATPLDPDAGRVLSLSTDDTYIWTLRDAGSHRYLLGHPVDAPTGTGRERCFFRRPRAEGAIRIVDARSISESSVAVMAENGLWLYSLAARSWYRLQPDPLQSPGRMYLLDNGEDDVLLLEEPQGGEAAKLHFVSVSSIQVPDSCSTGPATMSVKDTRVTVSADVNERAGRAAWIESDGSVWEWSGNSRAQVLAPSGEGPDLGQVKRVYERQDWLLFTTASGLWRYDLGQRAWQNINLNLDDAGPTLDINVERDQDLDVVTVHTGSGDIYLGTLTDTQNRVSLDRVYQGNQVAFGSSGEALVDVQLRSTNENRWTFVLADRVQYYDPAHRTWERTEPVASSTPISFQEALGWGIIVGNGGQSWWISEQKMSHPMLFREFVRDASDQALALDSGGTIWRLSLDGEIRRCAAEDSYSCQKHGRPLFLLDPSTVQHAFAWEHYLLFDTSGGLRALDEDTGVEAALLPVVASFEGALVSFEMENHLWLYNGSDLLALDRDLQGVLHTGIKNLMWDPQREMWGEMDNGWHWRKDGAWQPVDDLPGGVDGMQVFVLPGVNVSALGSDLQAYYWTGTQLRPDDLTLPPGLPPVEQMIRGYYQDWWVVGQGQVYHVKRGFCDQPGDGQTAPITATVATPCLEVAGQVELSLPDVVYAHVLVGERLELHSRDGRSLTVTTEADGTYRADLASDTISRPDLALDDSWPTLQANVVRLQNGQLVYDPVVRMELNAGGELVARQVSGREEVLATAAKIAGRFESPFSMPSALNVGWLQWDRDDHFFLVQTPSGFQTFSVDQFIQNEQLAFEGVVALLGVSTDKLYAATRFGVWAFDASSLSLDNQNVIYYPPTPKTALIRSAAHGRFLADNIGLVVDPSTLKEVGLQPVSIQVGEATFTEGADADHVEVSLLVGGVPTWGAAGRQFLWDSHRKMVAYDGTNLLMQSDAGIHEARHLAGFDRGPTDVPLSSGELQSDGAGKLCFLASGLWYQRVNGTWTGPVSDPLATGTLVQTSNWEWLRRAGQIEINLVAPAFQFGLVQDRGDLEFSFDRIQAAAAYHNRLYASTAAFLEVAGQAEDLGTLSSTHYPPVRSDHFDVFRMAADQALFSYDPEGTYRWDDQQSQFVAVSVEEDPARHRSLLATERLRLTWDQNRVIKELWVEAVDGSGRWVPFTFVNNRFPFDYVTSLATFDGRLYVGTSAGLESYDRVDATGLDDMTSLLDTRATPATPLQAVTYLGTPVDDIDLLVARSAQGCLSQSAGQMFLPCSLDQPLQPELRVRSNFWQWTRTLDDQIVGYYVTSDEQLAGNQIQFIEGFWPHDAFADVAVCHGRVATLWYGGWMSMHGGSTLTINSTLRNYDLSPLTPQHLICLEQEVAMSNRSLEPGLYLQTVDGHFWVYDNSDWRKVDDPFIVTDLQQFVATPPVFYAPHLRLLERSSSTPFVFEQRAMNGSWSALPWLESGQVAVDEWHEMVWNGSQLWVATPVGLVAFQRGRGHTDPVLLAPDQLRVIREPLVDGQACNITDLRLKEENVLVRCGNRSDQVFQGRVDTDRDQNVFLNKVTGSDPFAERGLVSAQDTGFWSFELAGRAAGKPGFLKASLHEEEVQLVAGRFQFDTINSFALFNEGMVELATDSGGWYQAPRGARLGVSDLARSPVAGEVGQANWVGLAGRTKDRALCLRLASGSEVVLLDTEYSIESRPSMCAEYQGEASLWLYEAGNSELAIVAPDSIGGLGTRLLLGGRFNDDIALGLPVTQMIEGETAYLLPTAAGVVRWSSDLQSEVLHTGPFDGLPDGETPTVVYMVTPEVAAYLGDGRLYELSDTRDPVQGFAIGQLGGTRVQTVGAGPRDLVLVRWLRGDSSGWSFLTPDNRIYVENTLLVDVSEFERYIQHQLEWGSPVPLLTISYNSRQVGISFGSQPTSLAELPAQFELITPILSEDRILLIGRQDLLELDLETGMGTAMDTAKGE